MRFCLVLGLLLSASAWARDDRFSHLPADCGDELISPLEIDGTPPENPHLVFRGQLTWFRDDSGKEWPALRDRELAEKVTPNPSSAHAYLRPGDALFIYAEGTPRKIVLEGVIGRDLNTGKLTVFDHDRVVISHRELKDLVSRKREALLVRLIDDLELREWRDRLNPWLVRYRRHLRADDRTVEIGRQRVERPHFQKHFGGQAVFQNIEGGGLRLWIQAESGRIELGEGDRLFLLDEKGAIFFDQRLGQDLSALKPELLRAKGAAAFTIPF